MAYLGRQPIIGNYQVLDALTATTTDTYALTKNSVAVFPQTPANCIVSLNGVIQAPFSSYNISGSNIVFASALTGSDSIDFITVLGDVLNVGTVSDGTIGLAKLSATGTKDATTFLRGDNTFAVPAGETNTPAFLVRLTGNQSVPSGANTKLLFNREEMDTDNAYDSTNYRFVPQVAGYYYIGTRITSEGVNNAQSLNIYRNGTIVVEYQVNASASATSSQINEALVYLNGSSDYVEIYVYQGSGSNKTYYGADYNCQFYGFRVIGA